MVWFEIVIWKFGVKIKSLFLLYLVSGGIRRHKNILLLLTFDKQSQIIQKLFFVRFFCCGKEI